MFEFVDHRYVVVGGLLFACILYRVPLYLLLAVAAFGVASYVWKQYEAGWRFSFGHDDGYYGFVRRKRRRQQQLNVRPTSAASASTSLNYSAIPTPKLRLDFDWNSPTNLSSSSPRPFSQRPFTSFGSTSPWMMESSNTDGMFSKPRYSGIGVYPFVQLEPRRPTMLSYCNSNMVKNKVTVKVALPERTSGYNTTPLAGSCSSAAASTLSSNVPPADCTTVIEALRTTRKRPMKEDGSSQENASPKRRFRHKVSSVDVSSDAASPHLPTEIAQHFESQLSDESLAILLPPVSSSSSSSSAALPSHAVKKTNPPPIQPPMPPRIMGGASTNAINSSYSSSRRHEQRELERKTKRKNESATQDSPEAKIGRNQSGAPEELAEASKSAATDQAEVSATKPLTSFVEIYRLEPFLDGTTDVAAHPPEQNTYSVHTTLTGARNPMAVHIPNYIPSLEDHLEDKRADKRRLEKLLGCFSKPSDTEKILDKPDEAVSASSQQSSSTLSSTIIASKEPASVTTIAAISSSSVGSIQTSLAPPQPIITATSSLFSTNSFAPILSNTTATVASSSTSALATAVSRNDVSSSTGNSLANFLTSPNVVTPSQSMTAVAPVTVVTSSKPFQMSVTSLAPQPTKNNESFTFGASTTDPQSKNPAPTFASPIAFSVAITNPLSNSATAVAAAVPSTTSNGTFQFGGGSNPIASVLNPAVSQPQTTTSSSPMFNFGGQGQSSASNQFGDVTTRPTTNIGSFFGSSASTAAAAVNGTSKPGGFSFDLQGVTGTMSTYNNNNNQQSTNNGLFTFGSSAASPLATSAFNFSSNTTPTFNFGAGNSATGFTPLSKLPEASALAPLSPANMFSTTGSGSPLSTSSTRRYKQTLPRHRASRR